MKKDPFEIARAWVWCVYFNTVLIILLIRMFVLVIIRTYSIIFFIIGFIGMFATKLTNAHVPVNLAICIFRRTQQIICPRDSA